MNSECEIGKVEERHWLFTSNCLIFLWNIYYLCKRQKILEKTASTLIPLNSFLTLPPLRSPNTVALKNSAFHMAHSGNVWVPDLTVLSKSHFHAIHRIYLTPCITDEKHGLNVAFGLQLGWLGNGGATKPRYKSYPVKVIVNAVSLLFYSSSAIFLVTGQQDVERSKWIHFS